MRVEIHRDVPSAVAESHDQHTSLSKSLAVAIVTAMDEVAAKALAARPRGHKGHRIGPRGDDDATGSDTRGTRVGDPAVTAPREPRNPVAEERVDLEVSRIELQVLDHLLT
jgi:hypothetical protein